MNDNDPEEIEDLTYRVKLLREELEKGNIKFAPHLVEGFKSSCDKIRFDTNGRVIPSSVDSRIRAMTLGLSHFKYRSNVKDQISLHQIQESYFKFLEVNFGEFHRATLEKKSDPNQAAHYFSHREDFVKHFTASLPDLMKYIHEFWESLGDAVSIHLEDEMNLKAAFGGDLFPSYTKNISSTCSLYIDTIILPCPLMRCANLINVWTPQETTYFILKHCINALNYKELALATDFPIVAILPDYSVFKEHHQDYLKRISEIDTLKHLKALFGRDFESLEDAFDFSNQIKTPEELLKYIKNQELLLFDTEWGGSKIEQINRYLHEQKSINEKLGGNNLGKIIVSTSFGRMSQANDLLMRSRDLRATPLIDAETSWRYFNWKLGYDSQEIDDDVRGKINLHTVRALQSGASKELTWLGNISPQDIIKIRKLDESGEIRQILSGGISELIKLNPTNFFRTSDQVIDNINEALGKHQAKLKELRDKKMKFYGVDVASCLVVGGISIAASFINPALAALVAGVGWLGVAPSPKEVKKDFENLQKEKKKIKESATGLFFKEAVKKN